MRKNILNKYYNQKVLDFGRLVFLDFKDHELEFNDFEGEIYLELEKGTIIFRPYPTLDGDLIYLYEASSNKEDRKRISFRKEFSEVIEETLLNIEFYNIGELLSAVNLQFKDFILRIFLTDSDELNVKLLMKNM